jgi:hypothetical protein
MCTLIGGSLGHTSGHTSTVMVGWAEGSLGHTCTAIVGWADGCSIFADWWHLQCSEVCLGAKDGTWARGKSNKYSCTRPTPHTSFSCQSRPCQRKRPTAALQSLPLRRNVRTIPLPTLRPFLPASVPTWPRCAEKAQQGHTESARAKSKASKASKDGSKQRCKPANMQASKDASKQRCKQAKIEARR